MALRNARLAAAALLAAVLVAVPAAASGPYAVTATATSRTGPLTRTELTIQAGVHPLDRFKMVRVARAHTGRGAILFLPPLGTTFAFYEQRDENGAIGTSIAEYFALRGFDVYGMSPRFEGIPAGTCEAGVLDCSVMATWDLTSMLDDIAFVRSRISALHPGAKVVAGGASLGGILAVALADAAPGDYAGVFPWEGMLATPDPGVQALNQGYCTALEAQLAAGILYEGVGANVFREVTKNAGNTPDGLTPIPLFPPTLTNHEVMVLLLSVPSPGPFTMPTPGYFQMAGSLAEDRLFFASDARVIENVSRFNSYVPLALVRDISCSLAGVETSFTDNLASFTRPVLMLGSGHGFGPYMDDQLADFGSTDKRLILEPDFGHIDHMMTPRHRDFVERPIFEWAERVVGH
jgi:pimeloyl-ACP methyl ester carboxylesterase